MACETCTRLDRDEELLRLAVEERAEALRFGLSEDVRAAVEDEERLLAALLAPRSRRRERPSSRLSVAQPNRHSWCRGVVSCGHRLVDTRGRQREAGE